MEFNITSFDNINNFPTTKVINSVISHRTKLMNMEQLLIPHITLTPPTTFSIIGETPGVMSWIAKNNDGAIIGSVALNTSNSVMHSLWVEEEYRNIGVGKTLYNTVKQFCDTNCIKLKLFVLANNTGAIKFYERIGNYASYTIMQPNDLE